MFKIYLALVATVSLSCLAQPPERRRSSLTQYREQESRPAVSSTGLQTQETGYDHYNQYTDSHVPVEKPKARLKIRRRPKKTFYPKVVSFYQKPTANNGYEFKYLTEDGVQRVERGYLSHDGVWTVEGSVTSLSEGNVAVVQSYIADGSGYKSSIRRYTPEKYHSLDDFIPWATGRNDFEDDNKLGAGTIGSLLGKS